MNNASHSEKKIAVISRSSHRGGAESAFMNLILILSKMPDYRVISIFPDNIGPLFSLCQSLGLNPQVITMSSMLGDPVISAINLSNNSFNTLQYFLEKSSVDLVVTNTLDIFDGALAAANLGIPHVWYIHEIVNRSPEFRSAAVAEKAFSHWINDFSDHVFFCSKSVQNEYSLDVIDYTSSVLSPFQSSTSHNVTKTLRPLDKRINLFFLGTNTARKNPTFAIEVVRALKLRRHDVHLTFVGFAHDRKSSLDFLVRRRGVSENISYAGYVTNPYLFMNGIAINIITANCEPFGLTIIECLERGIPVVAPDIDGPKDLLGLESLYSSGDLGACVRLIERISSDYTVASHRARAIYSESIDVFSPEFQSEIVRDAIKSSIQNFRKKNVPPVFRLDNLFGALNSPYISKTTIKQAICEITTHTIEEVDLAITLETEKLGYSVSKNVQQFDVVPFHYSREMEDLYRYGDGFYLELLARLDDQARLAMAGTILLRMLTEYSTPSQINVLAVGDGIGLDTIRIASAGFNVFYMDVERSLTSSIAGKLFEKYKTGTSSCSGEISIVGLDDIRSESYDAIICLEVIEHVDDPIGFLKFLSSKLKSNGLLFISDCFNGLGDEYLTHLQKNEHLSGLLHLLAATNGLYLDGFSKKSKFKPYIFRQLDSVQNSLIVNSLVTENFIDIIIGEQSKTRIPDLTGMSGIVSRIRAVRHFIFQIRCRLYSRFYSLIN